MWYDDKVEDVDKIDVIFYPNGCEYRGNIYIKNECVGDYSTKETTELEKLFPQFKFNYD